MEKLALFLHALVEVSLMTTAISLIMFACARSETYESERYEIRRVEKVENKTFDRYLERLNKLYELGLINNKPTRVKIKYIPGYYCKNLVKAVNNISNKYMEFQIDARKISNLFKIRYFIFCGITIVLTIIYIESKGAIYGSMMIGLTTPAISLWIMHKIIRKKVDDFFKEVEFKYGYNHQEPDMSLDE